MMDVDSIIRLGWTVQVINGDDSLTPTEAARSLLSYNESYLESRFGRYLPPGTNVTALLGNVTAVIPTLSHDQPAKQHTISFMVMFGLTVPVVAMRLYARKYISPKRLLWEDWWCLFALVMCGAETGVISLWTTQSTLYGGGMHQWDMTLAQIKNMNKLFMIIQYVFVVTHVPVKLTYLVFYHRVFPDIWFRRMVIAMGLYFCLFSFSAIFIITFQCNPVAYWEGTNLVTGKCLPRKVIFTISSTGLMCTDLTILVLPIQQVWKLTLRMRDKLLLGLVFGAGGLITVSSAVRLVFLIEWLDSPDYSYPAATHSFWILFELNLSVIICCAPALKVLFHHRTPKHERSVHGVSRHWSRGGMFRGGMGAKNKQNNNVKAKPAAWGGLWSITESGKDTSMFGSSSKSTAMSRGTMVTATTDTKSFADIEIGNVGNTCATDRESGVGNV